MLGVYPSGNNTIYVNEYIVKTLAGVFAAIMICALLVRLALFVFRAFSLHKIARRRGIHNAWMAWVPVCGDWIMGSVADQYQYVVKGRIANRRLPLFLLHVAVMGLQIVVSALSFSVLTAVLRMVFAGVGYPSAGQIVGLTVACGAQFFVTVAYLVIRCFVTYDLYASCTSRNNVVFLVLGLLFRVLEPVFFFVCRNMEEGMPPRKETVVTAEPEMVEELVVPVEV